MNDNAENNMNRPKRKRGGLFVIAALIIGMIALTRHESVVTIDCDADIIASKPDVIMLGAWWCTYCNQAKRYFQENNIHYCEYDMENTEIGRQLYEEHGGGAVVDVEGQGAAALVTGNQGFAVENPACSACASQTIGVRQPSRPLYSGQNWMP